MIQISDAFLRPAQAWFVRNKPVILQLSFVAYVALAALYLGGLPLFLSFPKQFSLLLELGSKFGTISVGLYGLTLLPGILKRLQLLPVTQVTLMLFRRQFGILMFLFAINHSGYSSLFPTLALTGMPPVSLSTREIYGTIAEFVLFPLFITSNDISWRRLGRKWWKIIHKLTYVALLFIFGHIVLLGGEITLKLLVGGLIGLELISWVVYWRRPKPLMPVPTEGEQSQQSSVPPQPMIPQV